MFRQSLPIELVTALKDERTGYIDRENITNATKIQKELNNIGNLGFLVKEDSNEDIDEFGEEIYAIMKYPTRKEA